MLSDISRLPKRIAVSTGVILLLASVCFSQTSLPYEDFEVAEPQIKEPFTISWFWTMGLGIAAAGSIGVGAWQMVNTFSEKKRSEDLYAVYTSSELGLEQATYDQRYQDYKDAWSKARRSQVLMYTFYGIGLASAGAAIASIFFMENYKVSVTPDVDGAKVQLQWRF